MQEMCWRYDTHLCMMNSDEIYIIAFAFLEKKILVRFKMYELIR